MTLDFTALYSEHADWLVNYLYRRTWDWPLAEDLAAAAWLNAWVKRDSYHQMEGVPVRAWLARIARNVLIDEWRRKRPVQIPLDGIPEVAIYDRDGEAWPEEKLASLTEKQRLVVEAHYLLGYRYQDLGKYGIGEHAAKKLAERGLAKLRRLMMAAEREVA